MIFVVPSSQVQVDRRATVGEIHAGTHIAAAKTWSTMRNNTFEIANQKRKPHEQRLQSGERPFVLFHIDFQNQQKFLASGMLDLCAL